MKMNRQGLITRIAFLVILTEVIIFGSLGWFYTDSYSKSIDEQLNRRLEVIGKMIANQELPISIISQKSIVTDLVGAPYISGMVIGGNRRVIVSTNPEDLGHLDTTLLADKMHWIHNKSSDTAFIQDENTLTAVIRIQSQTDTSPLYTTIITISTDQLTNQKHTILLWGQLGSIFFILLSAAIIIFITQRLITRRVKSSLRILKEVEEGNLDARISVTIEDEIGSMQNGINSMTEKLAEFIHEHRQNEIELHKQKDLLTSIIEHAPVRVFWKDLESRFVGCNSLFAKDAGMSSVEDVIGKTDDDMGWSEHADDYRSDDRTVMQSRIARIDYEEPSTTPSGQRIWLRTSKVPLVNENNEVIGILGIYSDITKRKALEIERQQREEELHQHRENLESLVGQRTEELTTALFAAEKANKAKSEFLSSMSHELRTPLNAIIGFAQLFLLDDTLEVRNKENVDEILKAGHHLLELINQVLDLAQIESGKLDLSIEPVQVKKVVNESLNLVSNIAKKEDIKIVSGELNDFVVNADFMRLKQALINLLSNAIKYNHKGGIVKLEAQPEGSGFIRIKVIDSGKGIPGNLLTQLFQPFNRLGAQNSSIEGTGIGLTITRHIVHMMGGSVGVKSEVGKGSTFWLDLPTENSVTFTATRPAKIFDDKTPSLRSTDTSVKTVLYIEDNVSNLNLVTQILNRRDDTHLLTADTAELGIELAKCHIPEIILLDINLPDMSGYEAMEILKEDYSLNDIPVIAVTANAMATDLEKGNAAGFRDYITKPIDIENFNKVLDKYLRK